MSNWNKPRNAALQSRTHFDYFLPVPVTVEIIEAVMPMSIVLFLRTAALLIGFSPYLFSDFTECSTGARSVIEGETCLTAARMICNMHLGNEIYDALHDGDHMGEILHKTFYAVYRMPAVDVVTKTKPT
jgi:hypothetical protein